MCRCSRREMSAASACLVDSIPGRAAERSGTKAHCCGDRLPNRDRNHFRCLLLRHSSFWCPQTGPIPDDYKEQAEEWRTKLIELAAEVDDEALEKYLEVHTVFQGLRKPTNSCLGGACQFKTPEFIQLAVEGPTASDALWKEKPPVTPDAQSQFFPPSATQGEEPDAETLKKLIRKGTIGGNFVPVLCGSAFKNKGVQPLLDAVTNYLPSPLDVPPMKVPVFDRPWSRLTSLDLVL